MTEPSGSCSTEKFLAWASALPTPTLNAVRRSKVITSAGSPKSRSAEAKSRSEGPPRPRTSAEAVSCSLAAVFLVDAHPPVR